MYTVDILIPTARFVFSVEDGRTDVLPESRSPEAFEQYRRLRDERPIVGMTTFPNTMLLRGELTMVVDPGLPLQNEPVVRALEARGLGPGDVDLVVLTHAHLDHAGACAELM
ncbi:MAG: MBL fold metallo-hydrolase, partial [Actinobacteria bacterium]|nr:MBL fold metallo-hydrolase [Actinomycetota bacterium]